MSDYLIASADSTDSGHTVKLGFELVETLDTKEFGGVLGLGPSLKGKKVNYVDWLFKTHRISKRLVSWSVVAPTDVVPVTGTTGTNYTGTSIAFGTSIAGAYTGSLSAIESKVNKWAVNTVTLNFTEGDDLTPIGTNYTAYIATNSPMLFTVDEATWTNTKTAAAKMNFTCAVTPNHPKLELCTLDQACSTLNATSNIEIVFDYQNILSIP